MFKFTPKLNQESRNIIENREQLKELVNCYGSPLNILFPNVMNKNISDFKEILKKHNLSGKIYYAHKCNKSNSFLKQALQNQINVDVASLEELKSALSNGFTGDRIEATGPKNDEFIILGISNNSKVLVVCHCYRENDEVIRIISARKATKKEAERYVKGI